jgi:hypothetical protein
MMYLDIAVRRQPSLLRFPLIGLSLVLMWLLTACTGQVLSGSAQQGLTWDILKNAEFRYADARIRLTDGGYRRAYAGESGASTSVTLYDTIAFGDLNADGTEDAAVILQVDAGPDESFFYLAAVINQKGIPYRFSSEPLGQDLTIHALSIEASGVVLELSSRDPDGSAAVAPRRVRLTYQLVGSRLKQISEKEVDLTIDDQGAEATASPPTMVLEYDVPWPAGEPREGVCWGASLSVPAAYAWRCVVGNQLFDPCFRAGDGPDMVCGVDPLRGEPGFPVQLVEPLPEPDALSMPAGNAWMVQLDDETVCEFNTLGAGSLDGQRISYLCEQPHASKAEVVLIGDLRQGDVWMAQKVTLTTHDDGLHASDVVWTPIRSVVQGPEEREAPPKGGVTTVAPLDSDAPPTVMALASETRTPQADSQISTPTPIPQPAERIEFGLGTTSTTIEAKLDAGESRTYVFRAMKGQTLLVNVESPEADVYLDVNAADTGAPLESVATNVTSWNGKLPETRDYLLELTATGDQASSYTLSMIIPKLIQFDAGVTSVVLRSNINAGYAIDYLLSAAIGQTLTATIESPGDDVYLVAYGLVSGAPLAPDAEKATRWSGDVPFAQDYLLRAVSAGETTNYRLTVELR